MRHQPSGPAARGHRPRRDQDRGDHRRLRQRGRRPVAPTHPDRGRARGGRGAHGDRGQGGGGRGEGQDRRPCSGSASARPETSPTRRARSPTPATCPTGRGASRSPPTSRTSSAPTCTSATTCRWRRGPRRCWEPASRTTRCSMVAWGTGIGGGIVLDGSCGSAAAAPARSATPSSGATARTARAAAAAAWRPTPAAASMEARARREVDKGAQTDLFKIMKHRGRVRLTSSVWAHALEHHDHLAHELIDPRGQGAGCRDRLRGQPARRRGGHHRRGPGNPLRAADGRAHLDRDAPASVQRFAPAGRPRGGPR